MLVSIRCLLVPYTSKYSLQNAADFSLPRFNTIRYGERRLMHRGPFLWDKLHTPIKLAAYGERFQKTIKS